MNTNNKKRKKMKNKIYKLLLVIVILFCAKDIKAQGHFEWATGWQGGDFVNRVNKVISSDIDREGNLYILGYAGSEATMLNDESLVPDYTPPRGKTDAVVIFKMNPQGEIVWKKAIYNEKMNGLSFGCGLKVVGDSSLIVITTIFNNEWLYFLDTIIPDQASHTAYGWGTSGAVDAVITFDLDGNKKEQHWMKAQWLDDEDSVRREGTFLVGCETPFTVDSEGNIIIIREYDEFQTGYSLKERVVIDGNRQFDFEVSSEYYNNQLFKFSPHFDSLLWEKDLIYKLQTDRVPYRPTTHSIVVDNDNNIYICGHFLEMGNATIYLDESNIIEATYKGRYKSFLIKYSPDGEVIKARDIRFIPNTYDCYDCQITTRNKSVTVDTVNNSIFVLSRIYQSDITEGYFAFDENTYDTLRRYNNAVFIQYDMDNLNYISHGIAEGGNMGTNINLDYWCGQALNIQNNRVFAQINFTQCLYGKDTIFQHGEYENSLALISWDKEGHLIMAIDYNCPLLVENNIVSSISTKDSFIYITGTLKSEATFGEYTIVNNSGDNLTTYIAKYVDTSFMSSYIYVSDTTENVSLATYIRNKDIKLYPNPAKDRITIENTEEIKECYLIDILGNKTKPYLLALGENRYSIDISGYNIGPYILQILTDNGQYSITIIKK